MSWEYTMFLLKPKPEHWVKVILNSPSKTSLSNVFTIPLGYFSSPFTEVGQTFISQLHITLSFSKMSWKKKTGKILEQVNFFLEIMGAN